jgi:endonuclease/exonuclease/phosphatase (EEP) superfamily protein YafD
MASLGRVALAALVAALVLTAAPAYAVTVTTQNVAHTLARAPARHDVRQAADGSGVVLTQEMAGRRAARFAPRGWGTAQRAGDCATYWDRATWRLVRSYAVRISHAPFWRGTRYALVAVLANNTNPGVRLATVNVHVFTRTVPHAPAFRRATTRVRRLADGLVAHGAAVVVGGDWNRDYRARARFPGFSSRRPPRPTGPTGGRVDYVYAHGLAFRGVRVMGHTYSDHNGYRARLARP